MKSRKRKIWLLCMVVFMIGLCAGCRGGQEESQAQIIRIAYNQATTHPHYQAVARAGEKFKEATDGRYEFLIYPNAVMGDQRATVELMQNGALQMCLVNNTIVENYNSDFAVLGLPYVFSSEDHLKKVFTSDVLDELFTSTKGEGFEVTAVYNSGSRNVYAKTAIETPADLKGQKIRVMESPSMIKMMDAMGGVGAPMSQGDVYTSIQQGMLDGAENNEVIYADMKHYEVAPVYSYTQHSMTPDLVLASSDFLAELPAADRELLIKIMKESIDDEFELWDAYIEEAKATAAQNGVTFVEPDITPFRENCKPLVEGELEKSPVALDLYKKISEMEE